MYHIVKFIVKNFDALKQFLENDDCRLKKEFEKYYIERYNSDKKNTTKISEFTFQFNEEYKAKVMMFLIIMTAG